MLSKISLGLNAVLFGSLALLATNASTPLRQYAQAQAQASKPMPTKTDAVRADAAKLAATGTRSGPATPPLKFTQTNALAPLGDALASKAADAFVPPIARRRPANDPAITTLTEPSKAAPGTVKSVKAAAGKVAPSSKSIRAVEAKASKPAAVASAVGKKPIDLSGRSALGAAPKAIKCNAGLKYDAKHLRCIAGTRKVPAAARDAKPTPVARPAPIPTASQAAARP